VGAHALGFHGIPRYTKDIDIWIESSEGNVNRFLKALRNFFDTDFGLSKDDFKGETILQFGIAPVRIDVLVSLPGLTFKRAWRNSIRSQYGSEPASYLSLNDLIKAKRAAGRKQDLLDVKKLLQVQKRRKRK